MEIPLYMYHDLTDLPVYDLPDGYQFRLYKQESDANRWAKIVTATNEFPSEEKALERFNEELSLHKYELKMRMIFIETIEGKAVGTATAWFAKWDETVIGRLHWIAIIPEFQGKRLGRPLITKTMQILQDNHSTAYLKTQESSGAAIYLYKQLGWCPIINTKEEEMIWNNIK